MSCTIRLGSTQQLQDRIPGKDAPTSLATAAHLARGENGEHATISREYHASRIPKDPWCWNIYRLIGISWKITLGVNVGKYSSTMDPLGKSNDKTKIIIVVVGVGVGIV